jgi:hypothetical protein
MTGDAPRNVPEEETGNQRLAILLAMAIRAGRGHVANERVDLVGGP